MAKFQRCQTMEVLYKNCTLLHTFIFGDTWETDYILDRISYYETELQIWWATGLFYRVQDNRKIYK